MITAELQRENMVESQVRTNDVTDRRILKAMGSLPREKFVPQALRSLAYMDEEIRVAGGDGSDRLLLRPMLLAKLIQLLELESEHLVLEIGSTTGYGAAVLASVAGNVVGIEADEKLAARASETLSEVGIDSAAVIARPHEEGYAKQGPYDAILLAGSVPEVPDHLVAQLKPGGRLVCVVGDATSGMAMAYERIGDRLSGRVAFSAVAPVLPGFEKALVFEL